MTERSSQHIYAVLTQPDGSGIFLPDENLPFFDLNERGGRTHESYVNHRLYESFGVTAQVHRSLPPLENALAYRMSVVANTPTPESLLWTPAEEAERLLSVRDERTMLHFVREAVARTRTLQIS